MINLNNLFFMYKNAKKKEGRQKSTIHLRRFVDPSSGGREISMPFTVPCPVWLMKSIKLIYGRKYKRCKCNCIVDNQSGTEEKSAYKKIVFSD